MRVSGINVEHEPDPLVQQAFVAIYGVFRRANEGIQMFCESWCHFQQLNEPMGLEQTVCTLKKMKANARRRTSTSECGQRCSETRLTRSRNRILRRP